MAYNYTLHKALALREPCAASLCKALVVSLLAHMRWAHYVRYAAWARSKATRAIYILAFLVKRNMQLGWQGV